MFFAIVLILITVLIIGDYCKKKRANQMLSASGVGGPKLSLPLIGDAFLFAGVDVKSLIQVLQKFHLKYGKVYRLWSLRKCIVIVQDAKYFEGILSSQRLISKAFFYDLLASWLGNGLLLSTGSKWHKRRKIITPTFHFKILEQFVEIFDQQSRVMVDKLRKQANGKTVIDIFPVVCSTAMDIIAESAMGVKINAQGKANLAYAEALKSVAVIISTRCLKPMQYFDFTFKLTAFQTYCTLRKNIRIMHDFTQTLINDRRSALIKSIENKTFKPMENESNSLGLKKRMTFLDVLLQSTVDSQSLTNDDIREEVDTFTFEGHDTTTSGISHTLYLIARHPEVQQKIFEEIVQVIGSDKKKPVGMNELHELKYLDSVIKESMRLYPPVPIIGRMTNEDTKIGDNMIPANTNLILLVYAICRDPDYFCKPNEFIPERFNFINEEKINPYVYVPFSAGSRNCIGQKFAILEMKSIISCVLRYFELLPLGPDVESVLSLIMRSATGVNIGLKKRIY